MMQHRIFQRKLYNLIANTFVTDHRQLPALRSACGRAEPDMGVLSRIESSLTPYEVRGDGLDIHATKHAEWKEGPARYRIVWYHSSTTDKK
jgi:hypothetical protein